MRRGAVAESYLDSLAVRLQCIRVGSNGRGWRRFLVFAELTKSKKGAEYVALFTYFSFQAWIRIIFCSGPRQFVNGATLWAVFQAKLDPKAPDAGTSILQFFRNIGLLADKDHKQAVILSGMLFTLVIWVFAALSFILAILFYLLFLWHWIPNSDGGLSGYCERKISSRLKSIVSDKVHKALEEEERKRIKAARKAGMTGDGIKPLGRQATLPQVFDPKTDNNLPGMPMLQRNDTMTTLPAYTSRPVSPSGRVPTVPGFELNSLDQKRPLASRTGTAASNASFASNAPLMGGAADMGYGGPSPAPTLPPLDTDGFPFPQRTMTANSNASHWRTGPPVRSGSVAPYPTESPSSALPYPDNPSFMEEGRATPSSRQYTPDSYFPGDAPARFMSPVSYSDPRGPPTRRPTQDSYAASGRGTPFRSMTPQEGYVPSPTSYNDPSDRNSPLPRLPPNAVDSYGRPLPRQVDQLSGRSTPRRPSPDRQPTLPDLNTPAQGRTSPPSSLGRSSPPAAASQIGTAISEDGYRNTSPTSTGRQSPPRAPTAPPMNAPGGAYVAFNPAMRNVTSPAPAANYHSPQHQQPRAPVRNMTAPLPAPPMGYDHVPSASAPRVGTPQGGRPQQGQGDYPRNMTTPLPAPPMGYDTVANGPRVGTPQGGRQPRGEYGSNNPYAARPGTAPPGQQSGYRN
jgi:hypothetical protein